MMVSRGPNFVCLYKRVSYLFLITVYFHLERSFSFHLYDRSLLAIDFVEIRVLTIKQDFYYKNYLCFKRDKNINRLFFANSTICWIFCWRCCWWSGTSATSWYRSSMCIRLSRICIRGKVLRFIFSNRLGTKLIKNLMNVWITCPFGIRYMTRSESGFKFETHHYRCFVIMVLRKTSINLSSTVWQVFNANFAICLKYSQ